MLLLLEKPTSQKHISLGGTLWWRNSKSFSISLSADKQSYCTFTGLLDYSNQTVTDFCCAHPEMSQICHNFTKRRVGNQEFPDTYSSASVASDEGWQSLPPGTLALLAGPIGLMVTQTTKFNKNKSWITERC